MILIERTRQLTNPTERAEAFNLERDLQSRVPKEGFNPADWSELRRNPAIGFEDSVVFPKLRELVKYALHPQIRIHRRIGCRRFGRNAVR